MTYYVMEPDAGAAKQFIWFKTMKPKANGRPWRTGAALEVLPADIELASDNELRLPHADMALNSFDVPVFSPRLRATLSALGVDNIQYAPVLLRDNGDLSERDDYRLANVLGLFDAVDPKRAKLRKDEDGFVEELTKFALVEDKILPRAPDGPKPLLFRLSIFEYYLIAHGSVKAACERDGITGALFTPTTSYV